MPCDRHYIPCIAQRSAVALCILSTTFLSSCTSTALSTSDISKGTGFASYSLPKALLPIALTDTNGDITLTVATPIYTRDSAHTYLLDHRSSPFASDDFTIDVDPTTGLLTKVHLTRTDETDEIFVEAAKSVAALLESSTQGAVQITSVLVDPGDIRSQENSSKLLNSALREYARLRLEQNNCDVNSCSKYRRFAISNVQLIQINITNPVGLLYTAPLSDERKCALGVCSRSTLPYLITAGFTNMVSQVTIDLPNNGPIYAIPLAGAVAVEKVTNVDFDRGLVRSAHVVKSSEALDLVKIPYRVVVAFFSALSEIIQLKIDTSGKQAELVRAEADLKKAKQEAQAEQAKNEAAILGAGGAQDVLLRVSTGGSLPLGQGLMSQQPKIGGALTPDQTGQGHVLRPGENANPQS